MRRIFLGFLLLGFGAAAFASMTNFGGGGGSSFNGGTITNQLTLSGSTLTVTGSQFSVGGSTFVVTTGMVGIGTSAPAYTLDVYGNINTTGTITASGSSSSIISPNSSLPMGAGSASTAMTLYTTSATINGSTFTVLTNGFVGIGTTSPSQKLTLAGGVSATNVLIIISSDSLHNFQAYSATTAGGFNAVGSGSATPLEFLMNGAIIGNISAASNWRIGDSSAAGAKLDVTAGYIKVSSTTLGTSYTLTGSTATGGGTALLGANCPATTVSAPSYWIKIFVSTDTAPSYIPVFK